MGIVLLGLLAGGAYGGYLLVQPASPASYGQPVTSTPVSFTLTVSSPEDNALVFDPTILIQGKTSPGSTIIISGQTEDLPLPVGDNGNFSTTIKLQNGVNRLTIASFDAAGNTKSETRTIFYTKTKL